MKGTDTTKGFQMRLEDLINYKKSESRISQNQIAKEIGIKKESLSKYLNDQAEIGINGLCKIADYFGVTTDYLLGRSDAYSADTDIQVTCATIGINQDTAQAIGNYNPEIKNVLSCLATFEPFRQALWDAVELAAYYKTKEILEEKAENGDYAAALANLRVVPDKLGFAEYKLNQKLQQTISFVAKSISSDNIRECAQNASGEWAAQAKAQYINSNKAGEAVQE